MIKTFLRRFKLGLVPTIVVSLIIGLIVGMVWLACVSDLFCVFIIIFCIILLIYGIGEARDNKWK